MQVNSHLSLDKVVSIHNNQIQPNNILVSKQRRLITLCIICSSILQRRIMFELRGLKCSSTPYISSMPLASNLFSSTNTCKMRTILVMKVTIHKLFLKQTKVNYLLLLAAKTIQARGLNNNILQSKT